MADSQESNGRSMSPVSAGAGSTSPTISRSTPPASAELKQQKQRTGSTSEANGSSKITKRRAARACVSCRARKVRCDVVEGAPCGNCRWDNVECIVQESRRRKKNLYTATSTVGHLSGTEALRPVLASNPVNITSADLRRPSNVSQMSGIENGLATGVAGLLDSLEGHVPHMISPDPPRIVDFGPFTCQDCDKCPSYHPHSSTVKERTHDHKEIGKLTRTHLLGLTDQRNGAAAAGAPAGYRSLTDHATLLGKLGDANGRLLWPNPVANQLTPPVLGDLRTAQFLSSLEAPDLLAQLPAFIKPVPSKIAPEDVKYLHTKGALSLPSLELQNALLKAYVEYVHPYMPLLELGEFLSIINSRDGLCGQVSLFLYQSVLFAATAFVEAKYLKDAGYASRKAARKAFFQKTRLLYDFDYESDRLVLVQALLLMTYWYETPDDQKDTWHWMGVAISLAHTIGLHRNPATGVMPVRKQKLWKRIWWSCFMRDRLIALGMRRATRINDEDFDVPMLEEGDFEIEALPDENQLLSAECVLVRNLEMQRQLALMCIEKAKLCICISHMLKAQYSMLNRDGMRADHTTSSTMMLFPNKTLDNVENVHTVDLELMEWFSNLPQVCQYRPVTSHDVRHGKSTVAVQRNLLHMVYQTAVSALHRPQFLPSTPLNAPAVSRQVQEMARLRVRDAASQITQMAAELHQFRLERYLPTTGVTVILPAMIIHLLEMKSPVQEARQKATKGFRQCMKVMEKLRDIYAAADFATGFLDAALRKAAIDVNAQQQTAQQQAVLKSLNGAFSSNFPGTVARSEDLSTPPPENAPYLGSAELDMYVQSRVNMSRTFDGNQAAVAATSPPHTDTHSDMAEDLNSSESASSDAMEVDMNVGPEDFDWNKITGTNLDFDQWLQFPAEGVNNSDETFMGMFGAGAPEPVIAPSSLTVDGQGMDWTEAVNVASLDAPVAA